MSIGQELLNVPMGDMIRQMALAIAEGQLKLDESSIQVAEMMGGLKTVYDDEGNISFDDSRVFFGYDYMTYKEAKAFLSVDDALSGGEVTKALEAMKDLSKAEPKDTDEVKVPLRVSMLELGFTPTFYQFVDTIIEVKIAIKITRSFESTVTRSNSARDESKRSSASIKWLGVRSGSDTTVSTSQVDASYSSKYSYSAEGSSLLRTKLSPLPPPPILEERIRNLMEMENARRDAKLQAKLAKAPA